MTAWLEIRRGKAPLIVAMPHTGTEIPADLEARLASPWLGRKDADWHVERLYAFAAALDATLLRTTVSRSVIDVNRDPTGASLYPGQATTGLCPAETFDGEPLWRRKAPDAGEIERRRETWFWPYHRALQAEIARLRAAHGRVVLWDAHAIRSIIPRLFPGELPHLNIGTNSGASCAPALAEAVEAACARSPFTRTRDGRFKGGWTTRAYGRPAQGVHAIQMELACRAYMEDPATPDGANWPAPFDPVRAAPLQAALRAALAACRQFAGESR